MFRLLSAVLWVAAVGSCTMVAEEGPDTAIPLTAEEPETIPDGAKPPTLSYVENRGAVFRTADGLFEISLGFNLQIRPRPG